MPKSPDELRSPKKVPKRKFTSLEKYVRLLSNNRHPSLRLNPDAARLLTRFAEDIVFELTEGGVDLMRWKNIKTATLQSADVRVFIKTRYPENLADAMISRCSKAERKFSRAKKPRAQ